MSISTNDLKNGMALNLPEGLMSVVEFQHVKPGKGGAFVRTKLKNVRSGAVLDRTFRADEKVKLAVIDKREMQFLYREGGDYVFMDNETYDQLHVTLESVGNAGDVDTRGWGVSVSRSVTEGIHASVDYTQADAEWLRPSKSSARVALVMPSAIRPG